jgi:hypothetical protein
VESKDKKSDSPELKVHSELPPAEVEIILTDKDGNPLPPLPEEEKQKIQKNKDDREAAEETLKMIECEFGELVGNRYWEIIRDFSIEKSGMPMREEIKELTPFDDKRAEVFMKQIFPRGKFEGMTVLTIEKKEGLEYLHRFATKQDYFQRGLSRYIEWRKKHPLNKIKKKKKGKK